MSTINTPESKPLVKEPAGRTALSFGFDAHTLFLLVVVIAIFVLMSLAMPKQFPTTTNFESMAYQISEVGILTVGMTLSILIGGIDLSVVAMSNISAIAAGMIITGMVKPGAPTEQVVPAVALAFLVAVVLGLVCGLINGLLIGRVGVPAILATLSTLTLYTGLAFGITRGRSISGFPDQFLFLGIGKVGIFPMPLLIFAAVLLVVAVILNSTTYGFKVYMLGANPTAARFSGIDNPTIIIKTHVLIGLLSAITGIVTLARTNSAIADYGASYLLTTILIAVLGGVAVTGGFGRLTGVVLALAALQMLSTGFNMLLLRFSGSNFFRDFAWGLLLLFVMVVTYYTNQPRMRAFLTNLFRRPAGGH